MSSHEAGGHCNCLRSLAAAAEAIQGHCCCCESSGDQSGCKCCQTSLNHILDAMDLHISCVRESCNNNDEATKSPTK